MLENHVCQTFFIGGILQVLNPLGSRFPLLDFPFYCWQPFAPINIYIYIIDRGIGYIACAVLHSTNPTPTGNK